MKTPNPNLSDPKTDTQWANQAVRSVFDICAINCFVVELNLYPVLIADMNSYVELAKFKQFLEKTF